MESHSVTCHLAEVRILPLPPAEAGTLDLATPEGCKSELTYVKWKRAVLDLSPRPVNRKSNALPQPRHTVCVIVVSVSRV